MHRQHNMRRNQRREQQKSLQHRLRENRLALEFLQRRLQADIDDDDGEEAQDVQSKSSKD